MVMTSDHHALQRAVLEQIRPDSVVALGTGPNIECFVKALAAHKGRVAAVVAASRSTAAWLETLGLPVVELNEVDDLDLFVTEPREFTRHGTHIHGFSAALVAERVLARAARRYLCMADPASEVRVLGDAAVPVEVVPMARSFVSRELAKLGGVPEWDELAVSETSNPLITVRNLDLTDPYSMEAQLDAIPGIVGHGLCARHAADLVLIGDGQQVRGLRPE